MPGSGDQLGDKLLRELKSALALLTRDVRQGAVDLTIEAPWVDYPTRLRVESCTEPLGCDLPEVHGGKDVWAKPLPDVCSVDLLPKEATLVSDSCRWEPVVAHEPILAEAACVVHEVTFDGIRSIAHKPARNDVFSPIQLPCATGGWPIPKEKAQAMSWDFGRIQPLKKTYAHSVGKLNTRSQSAPGRCWVLPLRRAPIPLHRLTKEQKTAFRKALAEKAQTLSVNIQIQVVFDRMNMALFSSIEQDERGNLLCFPKPNLVGAGLMRAVTSTGKYDAMYLVFGTRTDTQAAVKALVSMDAVEQPPEDSGGLLS